MCGSRLDVVLCSFAFERIHRRVPLCREHRQPLLEIDHFTRQPLTEAEDVPPSWARPAWAPPPTRRTPRRSSAERQLARGTPTGNLVLLPMR